MFFITNFIEVFHWCTFYASTIISSNVLLKHRVNVKPIDARANIQGMKILAILVFLTLILFDITLLTEAFLHPFDLNQKNDPLTLSTNSDKPEDEAPESYMFWSRVPLPQRRQRPQALPLLHRLTQ